MARPVKMTLKKDEQRMVLSEFKVTKSARTIAESLEIPHRQVMLFLESKKLRTYTEGSYA